MTTGATGQLGLALPVQGELSGTWGDTVNNGLTQYINIAIAGTLTLTNDGAVTLANTTGDASASNVTSTLTGAGTVTAQFAIVRVTGTLTTAKVVTAPSYSKTYTVVNAATGGIVTFKASGQTGVSIAVGESAFVYFNGTDYVKVSGTASVTSFSAGTTGLTPSTSTTGAVTLAGTLAIANGGTGQTTANTALNALLPSQTGNANKYLQTDGTNSSWDAVSLSTADITGTLGTANGGTNLTSFTSGGVVYASSTSALATGSNLYFDATNLGVGTNNPQRRLHVKGGGALTQFESTTSSCSLYIGDSTSSVVDNQGIAVTGNNLFLFTSGVEKLRITSAGDVGIGTSSPNGKLEVASAASGETVGLFLADATNNTVYVGRLSTTAGSGSSFVVRGRQGSAVFTANSDANNVKTSTTLGVGNATPGDGAGITFPATQSASSDANTLDDYEEGTWTPSLGGTATYDRQDGNYTKVGRLVNIRCNIVVSSIGTGSTFQISGLPFTTATTPIGNPPASGVVGYFASLAVSPVYISTIAASGGTTINVSGLTAAGATASASLGVFGNSARIDFTMTYYVD